MPSNGTELALFDYFQRGGFFMWTLLACSLLSVAVVLYKIVTLWLAARGGSRLVDEVAGLVENGESAAAAQRSEASGTAVGAVLAAILAAHDKSPEGLREEAQLAGGRELAGLEFGLPTLSTVATIAPLLGFLGTVSGMIRAFDAIASHGLGEPGIVAGGIGEALITTATGLIVAIPCFIAYSYFVGRVNSIGLRMELAGSHLLRASFERGEADEA